MLHEKEADVFFDLLQKLYSMIEEYASFDSKENMRLDDSRLLETEGGDDDIELSVHID